ncbi:MAG: nitroreductase family protein [Promethearchaeota archaeon]
MTELLKLIQNRHSSRGRFDSKRHISKEDLKMILEAARWAPTAHNMQNYEIIVIDDDKVIETIAQIESMISEEFIRENFEQLCFSEEDLKIKRVGILGNQFPPNWRDSSKLDEAIKERTPIPLSFTIRGSNTILIVIYDGRKRAPASEGDVLGFISLGCMMENIWLMAQALGISVHIMSAFNGVEEELRKVFKFPDYMNIGFSLKLGYPISEATKYLRVRREIDSFTHHNMYGNKWID